ncbi:MAG: hypothetical protein LBE04_01580 [Prevotellaceae bacterium]|nr:hypothetical protein [Prevotellaceae bacterium]
MVRKIYFIVVCVTLPLSFFGQGVPRWLNSQSRELTYPADTWFTGFVQGNVRPNETMPAATARLKKEAQGLLAENIRVTVESNIKSRNRSIKVHQNEQLTSLFESAVKTTSNAEIVGVKTESWFDTDDNILYAFASVNRFELAKYYQNQILFYLNKMESTLSIAAELAGKGMKMKAHQQCEEVIQYFATVAYTQNLLIAINVQVDDATLQQQRSERLRNELVQTLTDLENSIYVYVECKETVDGEDVRYIADILPGLLTENDCQCNFTDLEELADYVIKVDAYLTRCNAADRNTVFCYANSTVSLYNAHTQKTLKPKIEEAKGGWTNKNRTKAGEQAFDELAEKIAAKVAPMMKN